jgi:hypothetical protein
MLSLIDFIEYIERQVCDWLRWINENYAKILLGREYKLFDSNIEKEKEV